MRKVNNKDLKLWIFDQFNPKGNKPLLLLKSVHNIFIADSKKIILKVCFPVLLQNDNIVFSPFPLTRLTELQVDITVKFYDVLC